ncbi:MAG: cold-shock protein [Bacteriovoracaceae bacterium]
MKKFKVQFVKYDMSKTRNRKRKGMLVEDHTEDAVIYQLERIHKGEEFVKIHELVWDDEQVKEVVALKERDKDLWFVGTVKFFEFDKGFGFITPDERIEDLFFHQSACVDGVPGDKERVEFQISEGPRGLSAIYVRIIDE